MRRSSERSVALPGELGHPGAEREALARGPEGARSPSARPNALHHRGRHLGVGSGQGEHELVAPDAGAQVAAAELGGERGAEEAQRLVADRVAEAVVDGLEVIDVEGDHGHPVELAARAGELGVEALGERAVVREPRERVLEGEALEQAAAFA